MMQVTFPQECIGTPNYDILKEANYQNKTPLHLAIDRGNCMYVLIVLLVFNCSNYVNRVLAAIDERTNEKLNAALTSNDWATYQKLSQAETSLMNF